MPPIVSVQALKVEFGGTSDAVERNVPVEAPIGIIYGAVPFAVMMATPADIEDFVIGFSLTEGIIESAGDIKQIVVQAAGDGLQAVVTLEPRRMSEHLSRKRSLSGRTGCGVCGVEDLKDLPRARPVGQPSRMPDLVAIERAIQDLEHHQPLNDITRAVHSAAWFDLDGRFVCGREDVGRHNALDKLIGALLAASVRPEAGFIVITSRCSFEMVEKCAAFGASTLVAVSAPTSLAIERAKRLGVSLIAIARRDGMMVFNGEFAGHLDEGHGIIKESAARIW